jgi:hypothetical protein
MIKNVPRFVHVALIVACAVAIAATYRFFITHDTEPAVTFGQDGSYVVCTDSNGVPVRKYQSPDAWRPVPMRSFDSFEPAPEASPTPGLAADPCAQK